MCSTHDEGAGAFYGHTALKINDLCFYYSRIVDLRLANFPRHAHVRNTVFVVDIGNGHKTKLTVECL